MDSPALDSTVHLRTMESMRRCSLLLFGLIFAASLLHADNSFDLAGPKVDVHVKRGEVTLPISQAANLQPGDRLWIHPDLPENQVNHFVLIVAFLRGATNQPPNDWFTRVETWTREARTEGIFINVPDGAQQALLFLAPETGGDFATLRKAVKDRPGAFVRAAQDLQAASWDRMRLETYLSDVKETSQTDQKQLKERASLSARSLGIKLDQQCFDKPSDQQAPCLVQHTDGLVLDDTNTQGVVNQVVNGTAGDLMNQLSYSQAGAYGMYSAYIGVIFDMARILSSLHTAHFQYIPALALPTKDTLNLRLNVPPSFRDPKSVVVVALPPIGPTKAPPLHPVAPAEALCVQKPDLTLSAEGAPLIFATSLAHDLKLHIEADGKTFDLSVTADSDKGGLTLNDKLPDLPPGPLTAILRGKWGFDDWEGPHFHLLSASTGKWQLASGDQSALVVGREDTLHLQGESAQCVSGITLRAGTNASKPAPSSVEPKSLTFKPVNEDLLEVTVPLTDAAPGNFDLDIHHYGAAKPDTLTLSAYAEAASLDHLTLSIGDRIASLKGTRLDEVAQATLKDITWTPAALSRVGDFDQLVMKTEGATERLAADEHYSAKVKLRDGRELKVPVTVQPRRPQVSLLNKGTQEDGAPIPVHMASADDMPLASRLVFFLKSEVPQNFPRNQNVEVAAVDGSFRTVLSISDGSLILEDARTALGKVPLLEKFGPSAFGPLRARVLSPDGVPGDWIPLGTLVRVPDFKELHCPRSPAKLCTLAGGNLFLAEAISATQDMANPVEIPGDFTAAQVAVPHPVNGTLYLRLRDDPDTVQTLTMPVTPLQAPPAQATGGSAATPATAPAVAPVAAPAATPAPDANERR